MAWITVLVNCGEGPKAVRVRLRVRALVFGQLAVHPDTAPKLEGEDRYSITHIPTGLSVGPWGRHLEQDFALRAAARLSNLDWNFKRPSTCIKLREPVRKIWKELLAEVDRKHGVSTPPAYRS